MHAIELKGHWTRTEFADGRVRFARRFGAPRHGENETVWLVGTAPCDGTMTVNEQVVARLTRSEGIAVNISAVLRPRNEVALELAGAIHDFAGLTVEIR